MQVIVHGGAGRSPDEPEPRRRVLEKAAETGSEAATPIDAVEAAVRVLESSPRFNAGVGGAVQSDGEVRTDAGVMTDDLAVGAACSRPGVEHAVTVARVVLESTPHVLVSGDHALALAEAYDVETGVDLWTDRTRERWEEVDLPDGGPREQLAVLEERFGVSDPDGREEGAGEMAEAQSRGESAAQTSTPGVDDEHDHDTVGAVARVGDRIAAATSTGGRWLALAGRVGDVPQVGCGFYCNSVAGVSATGAGEDIARVTLSRRVVRHVENGLDAGSAVDRAIEEFDDLTGSSAGVIAIDADGGVGAAYNSDAMQTATATR